MLSVLTRRIFGTESFRLAALFAVLFLGFAGGLMATTYWIVRETQTSSLVDVIDADISTVQNGFNDEGLPEATEIVEQLLGPADRAHVGVTEDYIVLQDAQRGRIAGNLPLMPERMGLATLVGPPDRNGKEVKILGRGIHLARDVYLFVGRDTSGVAATRDRLRRAYLAVTAAALLLAIVGGLFFSVQFLRRIDDITVTCNAIVGGRFNDRIALRGNNDELDRLAVAINNMLDRIATLLENVRQVSSNIAHDLRTPLTRLRQRLETALSRADPGGEHAVNISRAIADTDELLAIFAALLRISQIEAGSRRAAFTSVPLSELIQRVVEMLRPVAEDHGQVLSSDIAPGITVRGDAELLVQLFVNLVENSIRHTPRGSRITVGLESVGSAVIAEVADDGPGIPAAERERAFQRFYRGAASRSTPGNGLGLSLVAAIAGLHQARLELHDNAPGLRVTVSLQSEHG